MATINVKGLGKAYKQYASRWQRLAEWVVPFSRVRHQLKWVLRDVSFKLEPGNAVGIIGLNGAGKSTLLKLITGTSRATTGSVSVSGRVTALLELGMGFHPDFTGRQNAYMAGQLIGLSTDEIAALMPEIEAFAEIGEYIDMPVRVYSSGMQMRLAFSLATCRRPDVFIVDEALSVGDAYFQHKSFDRIRAFSELGTTLLIVSHDKEAILSICDRAILLHRGRVALEGEPEAVMDYYNALIADKEDMQLTQQHSVDGRVQTISGTGEASVEDVSLYDSDGNPVDLVRVGELVELRVTVLVHQPIPTLVLGYGIKDRLGQVMYGTNTWYTGQCILTPAVGDEYIFSLRFPANFGVGSYSVQIALVDRETHLSNNYEWRDLAKIFNVINVDRFTFTGCLWNEPTISIEKRGLIHPHSTGPS